jgi:hypothetical protein
MVRYTHDFVILCPAAEDAGKALDEVKAWANANGLNLHPDETHLWDCRMEGQGFEFLCYRFEAGKRSVRKKSLTDKVRAFTRRTRGDSLGRIIADLNPMLKGWYGYFKYAHGRVFQTLDALIRRRLRALLRKQEKRPGFGRCYAAHCRWPNIYFASVGLFTMTEARLSASAHLYRNKFDYRIVHFGYFHSGGSPVSTALRKRAAFPTQGRQKLKLQARGVHGRADKAIPMTTKQRKLPLEISCHGRTLSRLQSSGR